MNRFEAHLKKKELKLKEKELSLRQFEAKIKRHDTEQRAYEMANTYSRKGMDHIGKLSSASLLINGGALTLSIGASLKPETLEIMATQLQLIHFAWAVHISAIVFTLCALLTFQFIIEQHAQRWFDHLDKKTEILEQPSSISKGIMWGLGIFTLVFTVSGLTALAIAANNVTSFVSGRICWLT